MRNQNPKNRLEDEETTSLLVDTIGNGSSDGPVAHKKKGSDTSPRTLSHSDDQIDHEESNYEKAFTIDVIHYIYVIRNLCKMRKTIPKDSNIRLEDLPLLGKSEEVNHKIIELERAYNKYRAKHSKASLLWPIISVFWSRIFKEQTIVIIYCAAKVLFTLFLSKILEGVEDEDTNKIYKFAICLFVVTIVGVYSHHFSFFQGYKLVAQLKPALIGLIYRKITRLSTHSINKVSIGKIVNIAANDLNSLEFLTFFVFYFVISPFVLAASLAILWTLVGAACIPGIIFLFMIWPIQVLLSKFGGGFLSKKNAVTDERVKLTNEMIEGIRLLKMYGWDTQFADKIKETRKEEVGLLKKLGYTDYIGTHLFARLSPALGSFIIFVTYTMTGGDLTASKIYATIMMLSFLRAAVVQYSSMSLRFITEMRLTFKRIIDLLEEDEMQTNESFEAPFRKDNAVEFEDFTAYWDEKLNPANSQNGNGNGSTNLPRNFKLLTQTSNPMSPHYSRAQSPKNDGQDPLVGLSFDKPTLANITFSVKKGTLCALVGKVGSGKSTALMSFFNEIPRTEGHIRFTGRLAYVEQEVSIYPGTVKSNILFGRPQDEERYRKIVKACCLLDDFKELPNGDRTEIGERGVNLSGGQKARIALARALYSDADIYLLDDPLSAVDTKVAKTLFKKAIRGVLKDKTVLLATHQVHFARQAEKIVVFDNGMIKTQGTLHEIAKEDSAIMSIFQTKHQKKKAADTFEDSEESVSSRSTESDRSRIEEATDLPPQNGSEPSIEAEKREERGKLIEQEKDESSKVGWKIYKYYIRNVGSIPALIFFAMILASIEITWVLYTYLLGYWSDGVWTNAFAVKVFGGIVLLFFCILILREILFVNFSLHASSNLHDSILQRVIRAATQFFDTNPAGRILNRFSNDVGVLDRYMLQAQNEVLDAMFYFTAIFATACILFPWLILPAAIMITFVLTLVKLLKRFIIQGRGVELLTRSPIYSLFSTTLSGLVSIRVYQQENVFIHKFSHLLNRNCRAFNFYYDVTRVFAFYCDMAAGLFACSGIGILVFYGHISAATTGLLCTYLLVITDHAQFSMRQVLLHIMQMASTARIKNYTEIPQEADVVLPSDKELVQDKKWPSKGEVAFNNVYLRYRQNTDFVLKGLNFTVKPGEKVGCVGRTGAGKSSIIQALFRMVEIDKEAVPGSNIQIDGVDTRNVGLHTIRKKISIIPQFPFVFKGTVKTNLDPLGEYDEEKIVQALKDTNLWDYIESLPHGLDTDMGNSSSVFSVGQKQLICLARTLLQKNKILVLDEATANIDFETDNFIQQVIMEKFKDSTIFTIAHRLSTVANYDKIMVMSKGRVVEFDHPYKLLVNEIGDKTITNAKGIFATMVLNTGSKHSKVIFEIAFKSYLHKSTNDSPV